MSKYKCIVTLSDDTEINAGILDTDTEVDENGYHVYPYDVYDCQGNEGTYDGTIAVINGISYENLNATDKTCRIAGQYQIPETSKIIIDWIYVNGIRYFVSSVRYSYAFGGCTSLESVIINSDVSFTTSIFRGCTSLESVIINSDVSFENYDFCDCTSLKYVVCVKPLNNIPSDLFYGCSSLIGDIIISDTCTSIGTYAFYQCTSLESITLGSGVTSIGNYAFYQCTSLESIIMPDSLIYIYIDAFYMCTALESVVLNEGLTTIGQNAFYGCESLTGITIPSTVEVLNASAFYNCTAMRDIWFNAVAMEDRASGNAIFHNAGQNTSGITMHVGTGVPRIPAYLFYQTNSVYAPNVVDVIFGEGSICTEIGCHAFQNCPVESINIPDSIETIEEYAFYGCSSLTTIYYGGASSSAWNKISIDSNNSPLTNATKYYYSETKPTTSGNYWHWVDDKPTKW